MRSVAQRQSRCFVDRSARARREPPPPGARAPCRADEAHDLGRLERRPGAHDLQEGRGRVRRTAPRGDGQGRRRDRRQQDRRRDPLGHRARRRQLVQLLQRRQLLRLGRLDRPRPVPEEGPHRRRRCSRRRRGTTRSTRASAARCRCSPTTTASTTTRRCSRRPGSRSPPQDDLRAGRRCEEADRPQHERHDQGRRLRSGHRLLRERPRALDPARSAASGSTRRGTRSSARTRPGRSGPKWQKSLVDWYGYDKLVRFQAGLGRRVLRRRRRSRPASSR